MWRVVGWGLSAWLVVVNAQIWAQEASPGDLYGRGVQAYYVGDYARAIQWFSAAVRGGSKDPRVFYFRGLAEINLGRSPDARQDFTRGAQMESNGSAAGFDVGRSLERVQGRARAELEAYRTAGRIAAAQARDRMQVQRYKAFRQTQSPTSGAPTPSAEASAPVAAEPAGKKPAVEDPFGAPAEKKPATDDPFAAPGEKKPAAAPKAADDPFAPAAQPPAAPAEKKANTDPFSN